jgi:hypothetical protein
VDILEVVGTDEDVVPAHQMHHSQKSGARHVAGQALNDAGLQVHYHAVAKTLRHERYPLIVRGNVCAFTEMSQNLDVGWQMFKRIARDPLRERKA